MTVTLNLIQNLLLLKWF